jgi:hypothetical protein
MAHTGRIAKTKNGKAVRCICKCGHPIVAPSLAALQEGAIAHESWRQFQLAHPEHAAVEARSS